MRRSATPGLTSPAFCFIDFFIVILFVAQIVLLILMFIAIFVT